MAIKVVNVIPKKESIESLQQWEPNVTANPANPLMVALSAHQTGKIQNSGRIFGSTDGGDTWTPMYTLSNKKSPKVGDITVRYSGPSNLLYAAFLHSSLEFHLLSLSNSAVPVATHIQRDLPNCDQPWLETAIDLATATAGGERVYVGVKQKNHSGQFVATVYGWLARNRFCKVSLPSRQPFVRDLAIRIAVHPDGTIYVLYVQQRKKDGSSDIIVARDDSWARDGAAAFKALSEPPQPNGDGSYGVRVGRMVRIAPTKTVRLGSQRVGSSPAIALDPTNSSIVYIAWTDDYNPGGKPKPANYTIHVVRSLERGEAGTWSGDLIQGLRPATNPCLAINQLGKVGLLYQEFSASKRWKTHFLTSSDGFEHYHDTLLANTPDLPKLKGMSIGDYAGLVAVGKNFYGAFCANNSDKSNFYAGVKSQRETGPDGKPRSLSGAKVAASIDPFFFKSTEAGDDFYVRDWTQNETSHDYGAEPSSSTYFWDTCDVWNRRENAPGAFINDQPVHENPGTDNWAYARISRKLPADPGTGPTTVTARFLVSKFGAGSNYTDSGSPFEEGVQLISPQVVFGPGDTERITPAFHFRLQAAAPTAQCLAVQISAPGDPYAYPSLAGNAPGWPTYAQSIRNDNNKASRNGLLVKDGHYVEGPWPPIQIYATIHNPATYVRDVELVCDASPEMARRLEGGARVQVVGGPASSSTGAASTPFKRGTTLRLTKMQPGENRWLVLSLQPVRSDEGEVSVAQFLEMGNGMVLNGFQMGTQVVGMRDLVRDRLERHAAVMTRVAAATGIPGAGREAVAASRVIAKNDFTDSIHLRFLRGRLANLDSSVRQIARQHVGDVFGVVAGLKILVGAVRSARSPAIASAHVSLLNRIDSMLTMRQLVEGDVADILQNVRWQRDLCARIPSLCRLAAAIAIRKHSERFILAYGERKTCNQDYPGLMSGLLGYFEELAKLRGGHALDKHVSGIQKSLADLRSLQKAHRTFLLGLRGT
jgi:hypothetical protein